MSTNAEDMRTMAHDVKRTGDTWEIRRLGEVCEYLAAQVQQLRAEVEALRAGRPS